MRRTTYDRLICSLDCLLIATPYDKLTVTALCSHAGITRRSFYKCFKSVDALVQHFFIQTFYDTCGTNMTDEGYFESDEFVHTMINTWDRYGSLFMSLERWNVLEYLSKNNIAVISELIKEKFSDEFTVTYSEYFITSTYSLLASMCMVWLKRGRRESCGELAEIIKRFIYLNKGI